MPIHIIMMHDIFQTKVWKKPCEHKKSKTKVVCWVIIVRTNIPIHCNWKAEKAAALVPGSQQENQLKIL